MPLKGDTQPYKVSFSYPDQKPATHAFSRVEDAQKLARDIARRGGNATVSKQIGPIIKRVSRHPAWTERDHHLAELIGRVRELVDHVNPEHAGHQLADELTEAAGLLGIDL